MDSIISLGQKNTLAEYMILSGADNRPPMLDKDLYDSWKSRIELYMQNREHGRMILELVENGPLIWPTVEENDVIRTKKYAELSAAGKIQADCDIKATNIILQGLPVDIYSLVNHHRVAKDLWERVQLLMQCTSLTKQERELINDMNIYKMKMEQFQVNTKFLNSLPPEWRKFVTDVKLVKDLHISNFDQLYAYLEQHELHANEAALCVNGNATSSRGNTTSGQSRVVKCYNCQGEWHMARQCTQPKRPRNVAWYKEKAMLAEAQEAGQILDEEQLAFLADPRIPADQVQTINPHNAAFQTEDLDTYDSDCDDLSTAQEVLMANISNYGSAIILEAQQDSMILSVIEQMSEQMINHVNNWEKANKEQKNESITAELERYKERVKILEQRLNIDLKKEDKYMENEIDLEKKIKELDNIICKVGQSAQTVHMLTKPQAFYDNTHKQALGYQNLFYLRKAQRMKPTLYDGVVLSNTHIAMHVIDDEETLILEEESRSKMSEKAKDPEVIAKKISHKPIDYEKLNSLTDDFEKSFSPQQELSTEQAFWFHIFNPSIESSYTPPVIVEVPTELPKVSLVNTSLKKLNFHLTQFVPVVKKRTTPNALEECEWGFKHTKTVFNNEIIPFLKSLKDIFNVFDKDLLNEITEVQIVFDQMDAAVQQSSVDKQCLEIAKKEILLENDRLLQKIMS
ncbi:retrovirus-related pol polyprotein from transposon TNT 1-94 [Tanacetum coccineum]